MTIDINYVLERLSTRQKESGGYYGTDITKLSKELGITPRGLRKQISKWKRSIKEFRDLRYLGQRSPSVTLDEFMEIEIDRVIEYIKQGKITITGSYNFQDLGKRIKGVQLCENEGFLTDCYEKNQRQVM
jgi:hypothetical protein